MGNSGLRIDEYRPDAAPLDRFGLRVQPVLHNIPAMPNRPVVPGSARFEESPDFVQTLSRGLDVIRAFDRERPEMTLSEIAEHVGLARAVVRRVLLTLEHLGYVRRRERHFFLMPRVLDLGFRYLASLTLPELAQPHMRALAERVDESCSLAVLDGRDIVLVQRITVRKIMTIALGVGARLPAYCTAMGRVLLAELPEESLQEVLSGRRFAGVTQHTITDRDALERRIRQVRRDGYALVEQELEVGLCSISVPIRDGAGITVAALNVSMPFQTDARERAVGTILPVLKSTARDIMAAGIATNIAARPAVRTPLA